MESSDEQKVEDNALQETTTLKDKISDIKHSQDDGVANTTGKTNEASEEFVDKMVENGIVAMEEIPPKIEKSKDTDHGDCLPDKSSTGKITHEDDKTYVNEEPFITKDLATNDLSHREESRSSEVQSGGDSTDTRLNSNQAYEIIDGCYHYTDIETHTRYRYDNDQSQWVIVDQDAKTCPVIHKTSLIAAAETTAKEATINTSDSTERSATTSTETIVEESATTAPETAESPATKATKTTAEVSTISSTLTVTEASKKIETTAQTSETFVAEVTSGKVTNISEHSSSVTVDDEGRTYYYAEGQYLCRDPMGNVYYMNENYEWVLWEITETSSTNTTATAEQSANDVKSNDRGKFHFYKGGEAFYRHSSTNEVFKFDKGTNQWELFKDKSTIRKRKRAQGTEDEEFDSESSEDCEDLDDKEADGLAPPGYKNDPNIVEEEGIYVKKDNTDDVFYEWDVNRRAWFPKLDEDFMAKYQMSYGFNPDGTKDENPVKYDDDEDDEDDEEERKKKEEEENEKKKKEKKIPSWFEADDVHNTKVYVTNLPDTLTEEEFVDLMQKCGLVLKDQDGKYKVKLYKDRDGDFKGDALCTYMKIESVTLALQILDDSPLGPLNKRLKVERAKFSMKGDYNASLKPKKKRKKVLDKMQRKQDKLFAWAPDPLRGARGKHENVVILSNVFSPQEFEERAERVLTHTETLRAQCSSFGTIKRLELFDRHTDGVVRVVFAEVEAADLCVASMNGRLYGKRTLTVHTWDGRTDYRVEESEEQKAERLKKWGQYLMGGEDKGNKDKGDKDSEGKDKGNKDKGDEDKEGEDNCNKDKGDKDSESEDKGNKDKGDKDKEGEDKGNKDKGDKDSEGEDKGNKDKWDKDKGDKYTCDTDKEDMDNNSEEEEPVESRGANEEKNNEENTDDEMVTESRQKDQSGEEKDEVGEEDKAEKEDEMSE